MVVLSAVKRMILLLVGMVITVGLCYIGITMFKRSSDVSETLMNNQSDTAREVQEYDVTRFDGFEISGSTAVSYIKTVVVKYGLSVEVTTTIKSFTCTDSTFFTEFRDIGSDYYINPMKQYKVEVVRDDNGALQKVKIAYVS